MTDMREFESDIASSGAAGRGDVLLAISNAIVRLYKECFGRGPTKAKTYHHGDVITCVLRGGLTKAEHTLIASGHEASVHNQRHMLQQAVRERFVASVEELTGRRVVGFMSGTQLDPDMSCEVFVLAPEESEGR
ncbi:MAG: hypothetical protein QOF37_1318 [Thermoleophilaceae bacterium]|jgi:uncharacterized protein YbcI|nr:hypothetical protein [Thermoleophilaceae bacterium]